MPRHYLLFASLAYAYPILRPLEEEIRRRGDVAAWFLEPECEDFLRDDELRLKTFREVRDFAPVAVFAPGNWVYDFFPGIKVELFHGYPIAKRKAKHDDHFTIRNWFDIYCTQGPTSTVPFKKLEEKLGFFKVYETGWSKADAFFRQPATEEKHSVTPTILYATTFTRGISSAWEMPEVIERLAEEKPWNWKIILHPKITDLRLIERYKRLAEKHSNITFLGMANDVGILRDSDVMLSDSSSIIVEYMLLGKPVVTYRNTNPGPQLINVSKLSEIGEALEKALKRPRSLMEAIEHYSLNHEAHRDGNNCKRILDAVDDFKANYEGRIKRKPLNLLRKVKLRRKVASQWLRYVFNIE